MAQGSDTRQRLRSILERLGYNLAEFILNPLQFGILPNSRSRYYLLAKLSPRKFIGLDDTTSKILHCIPLQPAESIVPRRLRCYLDRSMDDKTRTLFRILDRILTKWSRLFDIVLPSGTRSCCFTRVTSSFPARANILIHAGYTQMNEQLDTTKVFDEFLAAQASNDEDATFPLCRPQSFL
ncbi:hypothetical protein SCLCIDRAFT_567140 [Scleroderma citrinum Foug A]|uniref:Uncharacterized protein n=1 Tax=Scleroderma citrinum Foug A TaxID=1036808 RepID=A0A0C3D7H7_9AGAM|nr:hypothetical protein SCLCIDRAFT_567140 [Scleroderma citrinum Foug A]